jgi:drug/metabolite transporter (DMT)-like permease
MYPVITVLVSVPLYHEAIDLPRGLGIFFALGAGLLLAIEKKSEAKSAN